MKTKKSQNKSKISDSVSPIKEISIQTYYDNLSQIDEQLDSFIVDLNDEENLNKLKSFAKEMLLVNSNDNKKVKVNLNSIIAMMFKFAGLSLEPFYSPEKETPKISFENNFKDSDLIAKLINSTSLSQTTYQQQQVNTLFEVCFYELFTYLDIIFNEKQYMKLINALIDLSENAYRKIRYYSSLTLLILLSCLLEELEANQLKLKENPQNFNAEEKFNKIDDLIQMIKEKWYIRKQVDLAAEVRELIAEYMLKICKFHIFNFKVILSDDICSFIKTVLSDESKKVKQKYLLLIHDSIKKSKDEKVRKIIINIFKNCQLTILNLCIDKDKTVSKSAMKIFERLAKYGFLDFKALTFLVPHLFSEDKAIREIVTKICINVMYFSKTLEDGNEYSSSEDEAQGELSKSILKAVKSKKIQFNREEINNAYNFMLLMVNIHKWTSNDILLIKILHANFYFSLKNLLLNVNYYINLLELLIDNLDMNKLNLNELGNSGLVEELFGEEIGSFDISAKNLFETIILMLSLTFEELNKGTNSKPEEIHRYVTFINSFNSKCPRLIKLLSANNLLYLTSIILDIFPLLKFNFNETLQISNDSFNELVNILEILSEHKENNDLSIVFKYHKSLFNFYFIISNLEKEYFNSKNSADIVFENFLIKPTIKSFEDLIVNKDYLSNHSIEELEKEFSDKIQIIDKNNKKKSNKPQDSSNKIKTFAKLLNLIKEIIEINKDKGSFSEKYLFNNKSNDMLNFLFNLIKALLSSQCHRTEENYEDIDIIIKMSFSIIEDIILLLLNNCISNKLVTQNDYISIRDNTIERLIDLSSECYKEEKDIVNNLIYNMKSRAIGSLLTLITYISNTLADNLIFNINQSLINGIANYLDKEIILFFKSYQIDHNIVNNSYFTKNEYTLRLENSKYICESFCKLLIINYEITSNVQLCELFFETFTLISYPSVIQEIIDFFYEKFMEKEIAYAELYNDLDKNILMMFTYKQIVNNHHNNCLSNLNRLKIAYNSTVFNNLTEKEIDEDKLSQCRLIIDCYYKTLKKLKGKYTNDNKERLDFILKDRNSLVLFLINSINISLSYKVVEKLGKKKEKNEYEFENINLILYSNEFMKHSPLLTKEEFKYILKKTLNNIRLIESLDNCPKTVLKIVDNLKTYLIKRANVSINKELAKEEVKEEVKEDQKEEKSRKTKKSRKSTKRSNEKDKSNISETNEDSNKEEVEKVETKVNKKKAKYRKPSFDEESERIEGKKLI